MLMLKGDVATTYTFSGGPSGAIKIENQLSIYIWVNTCYSTIIKDYEKWIAIWINYTLIYCSQYAKGVGRLKDVIPFKIITTHIELPHEKLIIINMWFLNLK